MRVCVCVWGGGGGGGGGIHACSALTGLQVCVCVGGGGGGDPCMQCASSDSYVP